jgi:hypothetical protein
MTISRFEGSSAFTLGIAPSSKHPAKPRQRKGKGNEFTVKVFELARGQVAHSSKKASLLSFEN